MRRREQVREKWFFAIRYFQVAPSASKINPADHPHDHTHGTGGNHFHIVDEKSGKTLTFKTKEELEKYFKDNPQQANVGSNKEAFLKRIAEQKGAQSSSSAPSSAEAKTPQNRSDAAQQERSVQQQKTQSEFVKSSSPSKQLSTPERSRSHEMRFTPSSKNYSYSYNASSKSIVSDGFRKSDIKKGDDDHSFSKRTHSHHLKFTKHLFPHHSLNKHFPRNWMRRSERVSKLFSNLLSALQAAPGKKIGSSSFFEKLNPKAQERLLALVAMLQNPALLKSLPGALGGIVLGIANFEETLGSLFFPKSFLQRFLAGLQKLLESQSIAQNIEVADLEPEKQKEMLLQSMKQSPELEYLLSLVNTKNTSPSVSFLKRVEKSLLKFLSLFLTPISPEEKFVEGLDEAALRELGVLIMIQSTKAKKKRKTKKAKKNLFDRLTEVVESSFEEDFAEPSYVFGMSEDLKKNNS